MSRLLSVAGWAIEQKAGKLLMARFGYDKDGQPKSIVATGTLTGDAADKMTTTLYSPCAKGIGGVIEGGASAGESLGAITVEFTGPSTAKVTLQGQTESIHRLPFTPDGLRAGSWPGGPETGWYAVSGYPEWTYFIESQKENRLVGVFLPTNTESMIWLVSFSSGDDRRHIDGNIVEITQNEIIPIAPWSFEFADPYQGQVNLPVGLGIDQLKRLAF